VYPATAASLKKFEAIPPTLLKILAAPGPSDEDATTSYTIHAKMNVLLLVKILIAKGKLVIMSRCFCE
jgi:hypothetical protein